MVDRPKICFLFWNEEYKNQYHRKLVKVFEGLKLEHCNIDENPNLVLTTAPDFLKYKADILKGCDLAKVVVLSHEKDLYNVNTLLVENSVQHVVAVETDRAQLDLVVSIAGKIISPYQGRLKFDIGSKTPIHQRRIECPCDINPMTERIVEELDTTKCFKGIDEIIRMIGNELAANGVLHAPINAEGCVKYENEPRTADFLLDDEEKVSLAFYGDSKKIGVYVKDNFGRLTRETIVKHVADCMAKMKDVEETQAGFGAGLFYVFKHTNRFIINSCPGKLTECIMIIDREKRLKTYRNRQTTFSFYEFSH